MLHFKEYKSGKRKGRKLFSKVNKADNGMNVTRELYKVTMFARPFLNIAPDDFEEIKSVLASFTAGKKITLKL